MTDLEGRVLGAPFECSHAAGRRVIRTRETNWPCAAPRATDEAVVGEGFCPLCTKALAAITDPALLPGGQVIGRCPCCLGRWSITNGEVHTWAVPISPIGVELPTWQPAPTWKATP